jgi:subtilisin family serine protease
MKIMIFIITFILGNFLYSQERKYFYIEFSEVSKIPDKLINHDGTIKLTTNNNQLNNILNKYIIYNFDYLAKFSSNPRIQKTFSIICNDIELMNELNHNFPSIIVKVEQYCPMEPLFTPNDFSIIPPFNGYLFEQRQLDCIKAKDAWEITHGNNNVVIGINEYGVFGNHEELINKLLNPSININYHATGVAGLAAGDTNNNVGLSSIGFDCKLAQGSFDDLLENNSKVINMSWGSPFFPYKDSNTGLMINIPNFTEQENFNSLSEQQGVVLVAAAGNGVLGNVSANQLISHSLPLTAENYASVRHFPASYKNVISVSTVGNWNQPYTTSTSYDNWINIHKVITPQNTHYNGSSSLVTESEIFHQHNDSVDIVVPAYRMPIIGVGSNNNYWDSHDQGEWIGTSFSAPIVSGTIGLMFSVNYCLKPKEVETILKLTADNIEDLPENIQFHGKLGGGSLNAYKAVEMSNEMSKTHGTINVENRNLYRNWFYILQTAPFEIKMLNNQIKEAAKVKFFARNNIEILSGDYKPDIGYVDLQINSNLSLDCVFPNKKENKFSETINEKEIERAIKLYPNPNNGNFTILMNQNKVNEFEIDVFNIFGESIIKTNSNSLKTEMNISSFPSGIYFVKINSTEYSEVLKIIKD